MNQYNGPEIDYFKKNIHGPQDAPKKYTADYFVSTEYRESIKDSNKAAKKFLKLPEDQIYADVKAFVVGGARDSDTPASCN